MLNNIEFKEMLLRAAQHYCDAYCKIYKEHKIVLTHDDLDTLCNPNLQINSLIKTSHAYGLTSCLISHIKNRLLADKTWLLYYEYKAK